MALRWKKKPRPTGLAGVCAGPQGSTLRDGETEFASAYFISNRYGHKIDGWYWVARNDEAGVPLKNTCKEPVPDEATAKEAAMTYVRECLKRAAKVASCAERSGDHA